MDIEKELKVKLLKLFDTIDLNRMESAVEKWGGD